MKCLWNSAKEMQRDVLKNIPSFCDLDPKYFLGVQLGWNLITVKAAA